MPFQIVRNDITRMKVDAIVNTANPHPVIGGGTDCAIYEAAGAELLLKERKKIGDIPRGQAVVTSAFALNARYVIHTVGPVWDGGEHGEEEILRSCYRNSLRLAEKLGCESIAFPLISAGVYGFPREQAIRIALSEFRDFLMDPANESEMELYLVVFDRRSFGLSEKLFPGLKSYIDDHFVEEKRRAEYAIDAPTVGNRRDRWNASNLFREDRDSYRPTVTVPEGWDECEIASSSVVKPSAPTKKPRKLSDVMKELEETFQQRLFRLIGERGMTNAEVYKAANLKKQLFSKINSNKDYQPKKNTVLSLAIALRLNPDETRDLLARAGYALSPCSMTDLVVSYFLENGNYSSILDIDYALNECGQAMLGTYE